MQSPRSYRSLIFAVTLLLAQPFALMAQSAGAATADLSFKQVKPSGKFTQLQGEGFTLDYPDNWKAAGGPDSTLIAPPEAVGEGGISYGVIVGTNLSSEAASLDEAMRNLSKGLAQQNPGMHVSGEPQHVTVNGVEGRSVELAGDSPLKQNGKPLPERDWLVALPRAQGGLLYLVFVSPERDFSQLHPTYQKMLDSIHLGKASGGSPQ
jgi:beta-barrel assembly-enhancing protease